MTPLMYCPKSRRKERFATVADAQRALEVAKRTWRVPPKRWYYCGDCDGYHLTIQDKRASGPEREAAQREAAQAKADWRRKTHPFAALDQLRGT